MWRDVYGRRMQSRVSVTFDVLAVHEIPSTEPATVPFDPTAVNLDPLQTMPHHDGSLQGGCRAQQSRELWPILALIFTGPVLFVNVLLGGDRALQRAWIIALIGLACFGFLGRHK